MFLICFPFVFFVVRRRSAQRSARSTSSYNRKPSVSGHVRDGRSHENHTEQFSVRRLRQRTEGFLRGTYPWRINNFIHDVPDRIVRPYPLPYPEDIFRFGREGGGRGEGNILIRFVVYYHGFPVKCVPGITVSLCTSIIDRKRIRFCRRATAAGR